MMIVYIKGHLVDAINQLVFKAACGLQNSFTVNTQQAMIGAWTKRPPSGHRAALGVRISTSCTCIQANCNCSPVSSCNWIIASGPKLCGRKGNQQETRNWPRSHHQSTTYPNNYRLGAATLQRVQVGALSWPNDIPFDSCVRSVCHT